MVATRNWLRRSDAGHLLLATCCLGLFVNKATRAAEPSPLRPPKTSNTYVIAHRGAHVGIPENTLAAYEKAIRIGADFVEIDVRTSVDGELVSIHNATVDAYVQDGTRGAVKELTLKQLKQLDIGSRVGARWKNERIPTLDEILRLCKGQIGIYLDLKDASIDVVVQRIRTHDMEREVFWCISPDQVMGLRSSCPRCIPMPDPKSEDGLADLIRRTQPTVVAPIWSRFSPTFADKCHASGVLVFVDEKEPTKTNWRQALDWGADGIQTDAPSRLISYLRARGAR